MKKAFILLLATRAALLPAQNFVVNPDFENHGRSIPVLDFDNSFGTMEVEGWYLPTGGTADYLLYGPGSEFSKRMVTLVAGEVKAHSGNAYAGFFGCDTTRDYREFVGGTLNQPLEAGKQYRMNFSLALGEKCSHASKGIGIYFSRDRKSDPGSTAVPAYNPQIVFERAGSSSVSGKWQLFSAVFTASGGERFFVIGNFSSAGNEKTERMPGEKEAPWAYYLLDDVSLTPAENPLPSAGKTTEIAPGRSFVASNIYFETDRATIKAEGYPPLYSILAEIKKYPGMKIEIIGYTDSLGTSAHNQKLSEARAKAVADFFTSNGIPAANLSWKGKGESLPLSENDLARNRRVEFRFSD